MARGPSWPGCFIARVVDIGSLFASFVIIVWEKYKKQPGSGQPQNRKKKRKKWMSVYCLLALSLNGNFRSSTDRTFRAPGAGEVRGIDAPLCWSLVGDFEAYDWRRVSLNSTSEISGHWTLYIFSLWQFTWFLVGGGWFSGLVLASFFVDGPLYSLLLFTFQSWRLRWLVARACRSKKGRMENICNAYWFLFVGLRPCQQRCMWNGP